MDQTGAVMWLIVLLIKQLITGRYFNYFMLVTSFFRLRVAEGSLISLLVSNLSLKIMLVTFGPKTQKGFHFGRI